MATIYGTNYNDNNTYQWTSSWPYYKYFSDLRGTLYDDYIYGYAGNDKMYGYDGNDWLYGYDGDDKMYGNGGNDSLLGMNGSDLLNGGDGSDRLYGGAGVNELWGGTGDDNLFDGDGYGTLRGGDGYDHLFGGSGRDTLDGGADNSGDYMEGGYGDDTYFVHDLSDSISEPLVSAAAGGSDAVIADFNYVLGDAFENLYLGIGAVGGYGNNNNNFIAGNESNNTLWGLGGNDNLQGLGGSDYLRGDDGNDYLSGGGGADTLYGGYGKDILIGGGGAVRYFYASAVDSYQSFLVPNTYDTIHYFSGAGNGGNDKIDLSPIDANLSAAGNQAFNFNQLSYDSTSQTFIADVLYGRDLFITFTGTTSFSPYLDVIA